MSRPPLQDVHRNSNFAFSFLFLPQPQRKALESVYAFCRALDDVSDSGLGLDEKKRRLDFWRAELNRAFTGIPEDPVTDSLQQTIREFGLIRTPFDELMDGIEMDLTTTRYMNFIQLSQYCYRVAGTVGLICLRIFGCPEEDDYAVALGIAFQITNILRDVREDAQRGRIYLPLDDLNRFGYTEDELLAGTYNDRFVQLMRFEAERAGDYFRRAADLLRPECRRRLIAPEIMTAVYSTLLKRIQSSNYNVFDRRIRLSKPRKALLALTTAMMNRVGIGRVFGA
jgi:15-cis-phytoene synthase